MSSSGACGHGRPATRLACYRAMLGNVRLARGDAGLLRASVVNVSQIRTVTRMALDQRVGALPAVKLRRVLEGWRCCSERRASRRKTPDRDTPATPRPAGPCSMGSGTTRTNWRRSIGQWLFSKRRIDNENRNAGVQGRRQFRRKAHPQARRSSPRHCSGRRMSPCRLTIAVPIWKLHAPLLPFPPSRTT
jgi:hypothetical protein